MKITIIGLEASTGTSGKSGKEYDIGQIHSITRLAPPLGGGNVAQGQMGSTYRCSSQVVKSLAHLPLPIVGEADIQDVMRFGKREQECCGFVPEKLAPVAPKAA
jgi:hypothetical protein